MFFEPEPDEAESVKTVIYLYKINNEYKSAMELVYPHEEDLTVEMLIALSSACEDMSTKIDKVIDTIVS